MNREIKFRAKDNSTKTRFYFTLPDLFEAISGGKLKITDLNWETLSQFTGLKDKNGKEIYEGDIVYIEPSEEVKAMNLSEASKNYGKYRGSEVFWRKNGMWGTKDTIEHLGYFTQQKDRVEVIGNIYENPELLK